MSARSVLVDAAAALLALVIGGAFWFALGYLLGPLCIPIAFLGALGNRIASGRNFPSRGD